METVNNSFDHRDLLYQYGSRKYPFWLKTGNACQYILPFASQICKGNGLDIGGVPEKGWVFPGARVVNLELNDGFDAMHLPPGKWDYIFSSHTLEHIEDYVAALIHWRDSLRHGGILFLYLPHPDMEYWQPQNDRRHVHLFYPDEVTKVLFDLGFSDTFHSERDLLWSFAVVGSKPEA